MHQRALIPPEFIPGKGFELPLLGQDQIDSVLVAPASGAKLLKYSGFRE